MTVPGIDHNVFHKTCPCKYIARNTGHMTHSLSHSYHNYMLETKWIQNRYNKTLYRSIFILNSNHNSKLIRCSKDTLQHVFDPYCSELPTCTVAVDRSSVVPILTPLTVGPLSVVQTPQALSCLPVTAPRVSPVNITPTGTWPTGSTNFCWIPVVTRGTSIANRNCKILVYISKQTHGIKFYCGLHTIFKTSYKNLP